MANFIRLLKLCRPHIGMLLLGAFLSTLTVLANVGLLAISGWFLASMAAAGIASVHMNYFTPAGVIRFLAIVRTASRYGERLITHNATFLLLSDIRTHVFKTLSQLNNVDLAMSRSADLVNRMQNDVDALDTFYLHVLLPIIVAIFAIPVVMLFMNAYNPNVALVCFTALMIVGMIVPTYLGIKFSKTAIQEREQSALLRAQLSDTLQGSRELMLFQASAKMLATCDHSSKVYNQQLHKRHCALANSNGLTLLITQLTMLASVVILIPLISSNQVAHVELAMMSLFVLASFETVLNLPNAFIQLPNTLSAASRIFELEDKLTSAPVTTTMSVEKQPLGVSFTHIDYRYNEQIHALKKVSITISAKQKVALVGPSGSGKSTLINLLTGLWPTQSGQIKLHTREGDVDISTLSTDNRFDLLTILAQHHHIFDGSLAENLRYAQPDATDEMLLKACEQAQLGLWLSQLSSGLNTRLGTAGRAVSQGQARRIAIAQALLRNSPIMILDEPTESLDNHTKHEVINTIMSVMADKTIITITHDPALLDSMDKVIWLEEGAVRAVDTHSALLESEIDYVSLVTRF
ncbi:thiol reductant ABC exporter subunit CydC [Pseudoalteromonas sp. H105]|uniref:thiol reductant ABC exporter subunit CydC n=1 Tax=Pseudoalteromonas sp. H105 TaxID=1348393 RepID=UPI0007320C4C|nr:thiol reductant ABC exporter subunit CydC [Pseudoalteromonas sp. H105]KTF13510.1 cysteine ABC transporter ATP-binding protein [Pseudoalteromonas sp. H105]